MCTIQLEFGLRVVIKKPQVPGNRIVAVVTLVFESVSVRIVLFVTVDTCVGSISKQLGGVAIFAFNVAVFAQ
jgi:hypothetical protein